MTRHELKEQLQHDEFTDAVSRVVRYTNEHRERVVRIGIIAAAVLAVAGGLYWYLSYRNSVRDRDLQAVFNVLDAPVGQPNAFVKTFATQEAKTQASIKALSDMIAKDGDSSQGLIAQYYLGTLKAQQGDNKTAKTYLTKVAGSDSQCSPLAKIALAQLYAGEGKTSEARNLLQSIVNKPSALVSKDQADILIARLDESADPKAAKALLQSLKTPDQRPAVSRAVSEMEATLSK